MSWSDDELDARFRELGPIDPPARVEQAVLTTYRAERQRGARRTRWWAVGGMAAMAALSLLVIAEPPARGDPAAMVERGAGEVRPTVELKVAVRLGAGTTERFAADRRYNAGDTLMFRVRTSAATTLTLTRAGVVVWSGPVPAGESDLPVGYQLEAGEGPAIFALTGGAEVLRLPVPAVSP